MKVYFVYVTVEGFTPVFYGFTDSKDIIDTFKEQRNMSFYKIVKHDYTKKEFKKLKQDKYNLMMQNTAIKTRDEFFENSVTSISIIMTMEEEVQIYNKSDLVFTNLGKYLTEYAFAFKTPIIEALITLGYFTVYKMNNYYDPLVAGVQVFPYELPNEFEGIKGSPYDEFDQTVGFGDYTIDEFTVFSRLYGKFMNSKKKKWIWITPRTDF